MAQIVSMTQLGKLPKVSVCVITYNQEKYIGQCLQSIVDQVTDFDFDVIVGEDCSTDGTRAIVQDFAERYPEIVRPIYQKKNIGGGTNNFLTVHAAARGEYVAHVDGDDYCLPGKLQAQVELLDCDPSCNIVFHRMLVEQAAGEMKEGALQNIRDIGEMRFDRAAIIQFMAIGLHSSKMYRKSVGSYDIPSFDVMDYFVNVEQIGDGVARFVGYKNYGVYRMGGGIASSGIRSKQALAASLNYFCKKYPQYRLQVNTAALANLLVDLKNRRETWMLFLKVWVETFHFGSAFNFLRSIRFAKQLKLNG